MRHSPIPAILLFAVSAGVGADDVATELGGHTKMRLVGQSFPDNSLFQAVAGDDSLDVEGDLRVDLTASSGSWSFDADYQLIALHGDSVEWTRALGGSISPFVERLPEDDRRLFDLTHVIRDEGRNALLHRLDRLAISFTSDRAVVRAGRQALSWGNGLFYSPLDLVNPFDPAAIDTEFKTGDDMLYVQFLRDNGDDVQVAAVVRRDPLTNDVDDDQRTVAVKYHRFSDEQEYDLLIADSYGDAVLGIGALRSVGGAILRGDIVITDSAADAKVQLVTNVSYSWVWGGKNMSGVAEYFFNGFGQPDGQYDPQSLAQNPELLQRLARGELFTLGRHYVVLSTLMELHPLFHLTPNVFWNVGDGSALIQIVTQNDLKTDLVLLGAVGLPLGPDGTEFGGIETEIPGLSLSRGPSLFLQLNWYF